METASESCTNEGDDDEVPSLTQTDLIALWSIFMSWLHIGRPVVSLAMVGSSTSNFSLWGHLVEYKNQTDPGESEDLLFSFRMCNLLGRKSSKWSSSMLTSCWSTILFSLFFIRVRDLRGWMTHYFFSVCGIFFCHMVLGIARSVCRPTSFTTSPLQTEISQCLLHRLEHISEVLRYPLSINTRGFGDALTSNLEHSPGPALNLSPHFGFTNQCEYGEQYFSLP